MPSLEEIRAEQKRRRSLGGYRIWPERYAEDSPECLTRFLFERAYTYNEADASVELIPEHEYIAWVAREWWEHRRDGRTLIIEKSRRLIMSWVLRACELWAMGVRREKRVICGLTYPKAAEHVWRLAHMYTEIRKRHPEDDLPELMTMGGDLMKQKLDQVVLANGSVCDFLNQQGDSFQGSGYSGVTMEEFSHYRHPGGMYAQAGFVTQGKPGEPGGHVVIITNAHPNPAWRQIKE